MNKLKMLMVTATPGEESDIIWLQLVKQCNTIKIDDDTEVSIELVLFCNNSEGLCKRYNDVLDEHRHNYDYIMFIHADTLPCDFIYFIKSVITNNYPIMGLAGCTDMPLFGKYHPIAWNTMSDVNTQVGEVWHKHQVNHPAKQSVFGNRTTAYPVITIDGLCMIFSKVALDNDLLRFDETFKFDFYDMDLCFTANKLGIKIGVIHPGKFIHWSVGKGILKQTYKEAEIKFVKKWNIKDGQDYLSWSSVNMTNS
jgi:GT2 family glycosyltransferase